MACPDELTLDLWLADALPAEEAATLATHVRTCVACTAAVSAAGAFGTQLQAALALDGEELAHLAGLPLAAPWRTSPDSAAQPWGWIALAGVVGGYVAWLAAEPTVGPLLGTAFQVGLGTLPVHLALGFLFDLGQALFDLATHPALGLSLPLLALLALALLAWPRQLIAQRSTHA